MEIKKSRTNDKQIAKSILKEILPEGRFIALLGYDKIFNELFFYPKFERKIKLTKFLVGKNTWRVECKIDHIHIYCESLIANQATICAMVCACEEYLQS